MSCSSNLVLTCFLEITTQITRASADVNGYLERLRKMSWDYSMLFYHFYIRSKLIKGDQTHITYHVLEEVFNVTSEIKFSGKIKFFYNSKLIQSSKTGPVKLVQKS